MANQTVASENSTVNLGIKRDVAGKVNVEETVSLGCRTAYSLMGAEFHSHARIQSGDRGSGPLLKITKL